MKVETNVIYKESITFNLVLTNAECIQHNCKYICDFNALNT